MLKFLILEMLKRIRNLSSCHMLTVDMDTAATSGKMSLIFQREENANELLRLDHSPISIVNSSLSQPHCLNYETTNPLSVLSLSLHFRSFFVFLCLFRIFYSLCFSFFFLCCSVVSRL